MQRTLEAMSKHDRIASYTTLFRSLMATSFARVDSILHAELKLKWQLKIDSVQKSWKRSGIS